MSATILPFPIPAIPTIAQSIRSMCFRMENTRVNILRSCLCISRVSNEAVQRDEVWENDELAGYVWRFHDNSVWAITVDHDWASE